MQFHSVEAFFYIAMPSGGILFLFASASRPT
jgi:hypothetical protein